MSPRVRLVLKLVVTAALLAFVATKVDLASVGRALGTMGPGAVLLALVLTFASVVVSSLRWQRVLAHLGERVSLRHALADNLVGTAYNLMLPTSVGGDVARAMRCGDRIGSGAHAWASVLFERVVGLLSLVLVSCIGLMGVTTPGGRTLLWVSLAMTVVLAAALAIAPAPLRLGAKVGKRGFLKLAVALERMARAFSGPLSSPAARLETFAWSLAFQVVSLSILVAPALPWLDAGVLRAVYLGVPIVLVASMLPVTIGGLGLRESLFVVVLAPFGVSSERALTLAVVWLASNLVVGAAGIVVMLAERRPVEQT